MNICLLEPFHAGSHQSWVDEFARCSSHRVEVLALAGRHWKWRMHGGAVELARRFLEQSQEPDLLLTTDMLDLTTFLALTRQRTASLPVAVYFHENQLTYPWSPEDPDPRLRRDAHYGFINYTTALTADAVLFNSGYHKKSFLRALPEFLAGFPDYRGQETIDEIAARCRVLPLGLDLQRLDRGRPATGDDGESPLILWNHRWEYDKNPAAFFESLFQLDQEGFDFRIAILGEAYGRRPPVFDEARRRLGPKVVHWGFVADRDEYAGWLRRAHILPVHSRHDFFGASVVQAIYCGVHPLLPTRLAYPEHLPAEWQARYLYQDFEDLQDRLRHLLGGAWRTPPPAALRRHVARYDWSQMAPAYDQLFEELAAQRVRGLPVPARR